jgi:hypothetical protein
VSTIPVANNENIYQTAANKNLKKKIIYIPTPLPKGGLGETDPCKNLKSKISWHCPFKFTVRTLFIENLHVH